MQRCGTCLAVQGLRLCLPKQRVWVCSLVTGFPDGLVVKSPPTIAANAGDVCLIPTSGGSPETGNGNPLQYPCLEDYMDRGAWRAAVHEFTKSRHELAHTHTHTQGAKTLYASLPKIQNIKQEQYCKKFNKDFKKWCTFEK